MSEKGAVVIALTRSHAVFDWKNPLFRFGVIATAVWLVVGIAVMVLGGKWSDGVKPNEWGDIFAGLAAPVAFLWLVLGFVQQGHELKLSTNALMLQVEELKNTVAHQRDLAEATREQVAAALRLEKQQSDEALQRSQPRFMLSEAGSSKTANQITYNLRLRNVGAPAARIAVLVDTRRVVSIPTLSTNEESAFKAHFGSVPASAVIWKVQFIDVRGVEGESVFFGTPLAGNSMQIDPASGALA